MLDKLAMWSQLVLQQPPSAALFLQFPNHSVQRW